VICIQFSPNNSELNLKIFKTRFAYVTNDTVETSTEFHENLPSDSKVISEGDTDRLVI
jgi:hypothetical protein